MAHIFISYASQDRAIAQTYAEVLEAQGWLVWWDTDILPGQRFDRVIEEALQKAGCVIVLWSRHSSISDWVKDEAADAAKRQILIPVLIEEIPIPLGFRHIQTLNLAHWDGKANHPQFPRLLAAVSAMMGDEGHNKPSVLAADTLKESAHDANVPTATPNKEYNAEPIRQTATSNLDSEPAGSPDTQPRTAMESAVRQKAPAYQRRRLFIGSAIAVGILGVVALLTARFVPTQAPDFEFTFDNDSANGWEGPLDQWQAVPDPHQQGNFVYRGTAPGNIDADSFPPIANQMANWQDYAVEAKVRVVQVADTWGHAFWISIREQSTPIQGCSDYGIQFDTLRNEVRIGRNGNNPECPWTVLGKGSAHIGGDRWYTVRVEAVGSSIQVYIDGQSVASANDGMLPSGFFFWGLAPGTIADFDDVRIWNNTK